MNSGCLMFQTEKYKCISDVLSKALKFFLLYSIYLNRALFVLSKQITLIISVTILYNIPSHIYKPHVSLLSLLS